MSPAVTKANIFRSISGSSTVLVLSGSTLTTRTAALDDDAQEIFTIAIPAERATISSNRNAFPRRLSTRVRRAPWLQAQASPSVAAAPTSRGEQETTEAGAGNPVGVAEPAPDPDREPPRPPPRADKIELTIESLQNYELIKPIPVIVEPLGDKIFVAEVPEMDLSITGNSVGDTLILLKDHIATVYEGLRIKKNLDAQRARQLKLLEGYIGKSRRSWF
jgi:hypothetical protein